MESFDFILTDEAPIQYPAEEETKKKEEQNKVGMIPGPCTKNIIINNTVSKGIVCSKPTYGLPTIQLFNYLIIIFLLKTSA